MSTTFRRLSAFLILIISMASHAAVVINEIDYDQPGTDTAEFVELYNNGAVAVDLSTYTLEFINGSGGGAANYRSLVLSGMLPADGYLVICATIANVPNCTIDAGADNLIQNGAPDALGLMNGATLVDAVSYEGLVPGFSEGTSAPTDEGGAAFTDLSISRFPNGVDTNDNGVDFVFQAITPGASNGSPSQISIDDVTQVEGDAGTTTFDFTVSIDVAADATVQLDTADGSATIADSDYAAIVAQTVFFSATGSLTQVVSVTVNGDATVEMDETFTVNLTNPTGAIIADAQGVGTITNDDVVVSNITIDDVARAEGDAGTSTFDFTVSIDNAADATVQVDTADGSATIADSDYAAIVGQTVTFTAAGATTQTVSVTINGDTTIEGDETFNVNLSNAMGATITDAQGVGTINNDDNTQAVLSAVKSVSGELTRGGMIAYDIVISNSGPNPQNDNPGDEMTDVLPASLTVQSVSATTGAATNVGNTVSWNGTIPAAGSVTVTINALVDANAAGSIENQAEVFYDNDGDGTNESSALSSSPMSMGPAPTGFFIPFLVPTLNQYMVMLLMLMMGLVVARRVKS